LSLLPDRGIAAVDARLSCADRKSIVGVSAQRVGLLFVGISLALLTGRRRPRQATSVSSNDDTIDIQRVKTEPTGGTTSFAPD
jgi:hypothetical protein